MSRTDKDVPWRIRQVSHKKKHPRMMRSPSNFIQEWERCCPTHDGHILVRPQTSARAAEKQKWTKEVLSE